MVDVFSALVEKRAYKKPMEKAEVINLMRKLAIDNKLELYMVDLISENYEDIIQNVRETEKRLYKKFDEIEIEFNKLSEIMTNIMNKI